MNTFRYNLLKILNPKMRLTALLLAQVALSVASQFAPSSLYFDPEALDRVLLVRIPCGDCPGSDVQEIDLVRLLLAKTSSFMANILGSRVLSSLFPRPRMSSPSTASISFLWMPLVSRPRLSRLS